MKKFLTVLLALSVVFTYTVGTAFAASNDAVAPKTAYDQLIGEVNTQMGLVEAVAKTWKNSSATYTLKDSGVDLDKELKLQFANLDGKFFNQKGVAKLADLTVNEIRDELVAIADGIKNNMAPTEGAVAELQEEIITGANTYATTDAFERKVKTLVDEKNETVLDKLELEYAVETYTEYIDSIDENNYSAVPNENGTVDKETVADLKDAAKYDISLASIAYDGSDNGGSAETVRGIAVKFAKALAGFTTVDDQEKADKELAEKKADEIALIKVKLNAQKATVNADLLQALKEAKANKNKDAIEKIEDAIENLDAAFDAAAKSAEYEINACKTDDALSRKVSDWNTAIPELIYNDSYVAQGYLPIYIARAEVVAELEALATKMKAETGFNGTAVYDADAIAEALEADLKYVYTHSGTDLAGYISRCELAHVPASKDLVKAAMADVLGNETKVEGKKYDAIATWETMSTLTIYDEEYLEDAKTIIADTKAAVRAAKTVEDVYAAFLAGYEKFVAVPTKADMNKYQATTAAKNAVAKYEDKLEAALATKAADYGVTAFDKDYPETNGLVESLVKNLIKKAYDADDMEAKYQEALKVITELKTKAELQAEVDAINAAVAELPELDKLTSADENTVLALVERKNNFDEYKSLIDVTGYNPVNFQAYVDKMAELVKADLKAAYKAIGTVTIEDEAAIDELAAKVEAYVENYNKTYNFVEIKALYEDLKDAKIDAVEKAIGAIDASANPLDVKAIEAARAAYDALAEDGLELSKTMYHKLLSLENLAKDYMINAVESLKVVKNHSVAGKGYIKIAWSVKGDAKAADGYQIYRATKANGKYTKFFTTSKMTYKNTKSLKKGTKYFYKVRAYKTVDGVKYYSDWSNKAYRVAK